MPIVPGTLLGPYEIVALIGAGGMGEVYRARDPRMGREVAIKVSAERFSERFDREVRAVAALNHPNICHLYDVGPDYLVMELVEGESPKGPMPLESALNYARQIGEALEEAHGKGIVHRDLKPANIKITPAGVVKVLDFGLAKISPAEAGATVSEDSPTLSMAATLAGVILGTAAYMAPEQANGKAVDKRADIWAFGVVFYEMLTGEQLFRGEDMVDTLAAVVHKDPDLGRVPVEVRRLLKKCLERDVKKRLRDIGDAWDYLDVGQVPDLPTTPVGDRRHWVAWTIAGVLAIALAGAGYLSYRHLTEEAWVLRLFIPPPEKASYWVNSALAVSPDGRRVAFASEADGKHQLWVRDVDSLAPRLLAGTDDARRPFWSPDSKTIGFFVPGKMKKIDVAGGPAVTICDAPAGHGGTWNQNDIIVFAANTGGGLSRVPAAGGTATPLTEQTQQQFETFRFPWFLPDGRHFLYTAINYDPDKSGVFVGDLNDPKALRRLIPDSSNAVYVPQGYLLFLREHSLMAQPFDAAKLATGGAAFPIAERVDASSIVTALGQFSASTNAVLAYTSGASVGEAQLTWFDRSGTVVGTLGKPGDMQWPAISPDGKTVAVDRRDPQTGFFDIWTYDLMRNTDSRFTFGPQTNHWPVWSPDGSHIAFLSNRNGLSGVYQRATSGTAQDELMSNDTGRVEDWTKDYLVKEFAGDPHTGNDIFLLPLASGKPIPYLNTKFRERWAKVSPNGQWLAYSSDESGQFQIYVDSFPKQGRKRQVSKDGGDRSVWSKDGKELYFLAPRGQKMMAVEITGGSNLEFGTPRPLFDVGLPSVEPWFDVSKDGRFLILVEVERAGSVPMTVEVNWMAGLKK